jgi:membrane protein
MRLSIDAGPDGLPTFGGLTLVELGRRVWAQVWEDEVFDRAAALSYYFLFALFPALLFLTALVGLVSGPTLMDQVMAYVDRAAPREAASLIRRTLGEIGASASGGLLSIGVLAALWSSSSGMASVMAALNVAYDVEDRRPWWKRRLLALGLTAGFAGFALTGVLLLVFGGRIGEMIAGAVGLGTVFAVVWHVGRWIVAAFLVMLAIALVYDLAPAAGRTWRWLTPGSVFAIGGWLLASQGLGVYVRYFGNFSATYGSIGAVILLMLWLYLTSVVLLVGAQIDSEIAKAEMSRWGPPAGP